MIVAISEQRGFDLEVGQNLFELVLTGLPRSADWKFHGSLYMTSSLEGLFMPGNLRTRSC